MKIRVLEIELEKLKVALAEKYASKNETNGKDVEEENEEVKNDAEDQE